MISAYLVRGLVAGLAAGLLAGGFGLVVSQPAFEAALAYEHAHAGDHGHDGEEVFSRGVQQAGLVGGSALGGVAVGALLGVAAAWAVGRLDGDAWTRALKLGAAALGAAVVLPALVHPPNPPGVGAEDTVGDRTVAYLATIAVGVVLAVAARAAVRWLDARGVPPAHRHTAVGAALIVAAAAWVVAVPSLGAAGDFPADVLWTFRLTGLASQALLVGGAAVGLGLLTDRAERAAEHSPVAAR